MVVVLDCDNNTIATTHHVLKGILELICMRESCKIDLVFYSDIVLVLM